ncbi:MULTISPECIES: ATP-binding protein [Caproicibacterium]|uniref:Uncharacterized protein n=1 Tax=Caproicibacterium argilliputei TaxID=3030016 RepID=A0AA97H0L0_9FIRM|nr:hypothetical protein [Caproicibacterium argilliputei]WOC31651.1 hypothetical protein PXC00_10585 [Caproicibacterium argilliputei]
MKTINLQMSLISTKPSYDRFAKLQQEILTSPEHEIELHIDIEKRLGLSFLFCISTLPTLAECHGKTVHIICNNRSQLLFYKSGYIPNLNGIQDHVDIAPYLQKNSRIIKGVKDIYTLVKEITMDAPVEMSDDLAALFTSKVGEMYNNSLEHSEGKWVIGGKFFKNQKYKYCFACYDTGIGIPQKIIQNVDTNLTEIQAFKWAMKRGNSTANKGKGSLIPRGLGLDLLQGFAKANEGAIRICSNKVFYTYNQRNKSQYFELGQHRTEKKLR